MKSYTEIDKIVKNNLYEKFCEELGEGQIIVWLPLRLWLGVGWHREVEGDQSVEEVDSELKYTSCSSVLRSL